MSAPEASLERVGLLVARTSGQPRHGAELDSNQQVMGPTPRGPPVAVSDWRVSQSLALNPPFGRFGASKMLPGWVGTSTRWGAAAT